MAGRRRSRCCCFSGEDCEEKSCYPNSYDVWRSTTQAACGVETEGPWPENLQAPDNSGDASWVQCVHPQGLVCEPSPLPTNGVTRSVACRAWKMRLPTYLDAGLAFDSPIGIIGDVYLEDADGRTYTGTFPGESKGSIRHDLKVWDERLGVVEKVRGDKWSAIEWQELMDNDELRIQLWHLNEGVVVVGPDGPGQGANAIRTQTMKLGVELLPLLKRGLVQYRYTFIGGSKSGCVGAPVNWVSCDSAADNNDRVRIELGLEVLYDDDRANTVGFKDACYIEALVSADVYQRFRLYGESGEFAGNNDFRADQPYEWVDYSGVDPVVTTGKHPDSPDVVYLDAFPCGEEPPEESPTCEVCPDIRFAELLPDWTLTVGGLGTPSPCCPTLEGTWFLRNPSRDGCSWITSEPERVDCDHAGIGFPGGYLDNPDNFQQAGWSLSRQQSFDGSEVWMQLNPFYSGADSRNTPIYKMNLDDFDCKGPNTFDIDYKPTWRCRCCDPDPGSNGNTPFRIQLSSFATCEPAYTCNEVARCFQRALSSTHNSDCIHFGTSGNTFTNTPYSGACSWVTENPVAFTGCVDINGNPYIKTGFVLRCLGWWPFDGTTNGTRLWEGRWGGVVWANYIGTPGNITGAAVSWNCDSDNFVIPVYSRPTIWSVAPLTGVVLSRNTTGPRHQICEYPDQLTINPTSKILGC